MPDTLVCRHCRAEIAADAPAGLCPRCLVEAALRSEGPPSGASDPRLRPTTPSPAHVGFQPPAVEELAQRFPQWEFTELLGVGGMGAVYKARQPDLDRWIAVKILPPEVGRDPLFAERFMREARALAKLNHPNIVTVYDFGRSDGLFYFVMEYVDGANLRQMLRAGKLTSAEALAIVPQICEALQYAHDEGIVHRDIKPENILLDKKGRVKIADFGLSKLLDHAETPLASLTGTHQIMGTLRYMAPEQMEATKTVDHRADIYSLGVVFYELLTGEIPMGRFAPPSKKAAVDARLDDVVLRSLEREPDDRYQQAGHVRDDLSKVTSAAVAPPQKQSFADDDATGKRLETASAVLFCSGLAIATVGLVVTLWIASQLAAFALAPRSSQSDVTVKVTNSIPVYFWPALVTQFLAAGAGTALMMISATVRRGESKTLATVGGWIAAAPISPAWIVTLPAGLWTLLLLQRPDIQAVFARGGRETQSADDWNGFNHLGNWGLWASILAAAGALATFLPWATISIFGVKLTVFGTGSWYALAGGAAFLVVLETAILSGYFRLPLRALRLTMFAASLTVLVLGVIVLASDTTVRQSPVSISGDMAPASAEEFMQPLVNAVTSGMSGNLAFGFWFSLLAAIGMLVTACIPVRGESTAIEKDTGEPRLSKLALAAVLWTPGVWLVWALTFGSIYLWVVSNRGTEIGRKMDMVATAGSFAMFLCGLVGTPLLGGIALKQISFARGRLYGRRLAFVAAAFYPLLVLAAVIAFFLNLLILAVARIFLPVNAQLTVVAVVFPGAILGLAVSACVGWIVWRRTYGQQAIQARSASE